MAVAGARPIQILLHAPTKALAGDLRQAAKDIEGFGDKASKGLRIVGTAGLAAGAALTGLAVSSVKEFRELDKGVREIMTLIPGATEEMVTAMRQDVSGFSREFGIAGTEAATAYYDAISAGVGEDALPAFMTDAGRLAVAGATDIGSSVDLLTSSLNAFEFEADQAGRVSDVMFATVKSGKTTIEELGASFSNIGPIAAEAGVEIEEVGAWIAELTLKGTPTKQATTLIRSALVELGKEGSKAFGHFEQAAGKTFPDFIAEGGSMDEAFALMTAHSEETGTSITNMFGSVEAAQGMLAVTGEGVESFTDTVMDMANAAGSTEEAFNVMAAGFDFQMNQLRETVNAAKVNIGAALMPALLKALPVVTEMVGKVADMDIAGFFKKIKDRMDRDVFPRAVQIRGTFRAWQRNLSESVDTVKDLAIRVKDFAVGQAQDVAITVTTTWEEVGQPWTQEKLDGIRDTVVDFYENQLPAPVREAVNRFGQSFKDDWEAATEIPDLVTEAWELAQEGDFSGAGVKLWEAFKAGFDLFNRTDNIWFAITGKTPTEWAQEWIPGIAEGMEAAAAEETFEGKLSAFWTNFSTEFSREWNETYLPKVNEVWGTISGWFGEEGAITTAWEDVDTWLEGVFSAVNLRKIGEWGGTIITTILGGITSWLAERRGGAAEAGEVAGGYAARIMEFIFADLPGAIVVIVDEMFKHLVEWIGEEENRQQLKDAFLATVEFAGAAFNEILEGIVEDIPNKMVSMWSSEESWAAAGEDWGNWISAPFVRVFTRAVNEVIAQVNRIPALNVEEVEVPEWAQDIKEQRLGDIESTLHDPLGTGGDVGGAKKGGSIVGPGFASGVAGVIGATPLGAAHNLVQSVGGFVRNMFGGAEGAIVNKPTLAMIGEAGPEMLVPLHTAPGASPLPGGQGMGSPIFNITINTTGGVDIDEIQDAIRERVRLEGPDGFAGALAGA